MECKRKWINVSEKTHARLKELKFCPGESFDNLINRILDKKLESK